MPPAAQKTGAAWVEGLAQMSATRGGCPGASSSLKAILSSSVRHCATSGLKAVGRQDFGALAQLGLSDRRRSRAPHGMLGHPCSLLLRTSLGANLGLDFLSLEAQPAPAKETHPLVCTGKGAERCYNKHASLKGLGIKMENIK